MTKEKLIDQIMKECAADGEPVTREEAEEMAEMEIKSNAMRRYEKSDAPRKSAKKEREPDLVKREIIHTLAQNVDRAWFDDKFKITDIQIIKPEKEITFKIQNDEYSITLTKHRPKKTP